jgi:hypothetical protein
MAKAAAKKVQPRVSGGGRRRSIVDCRQMELFSAPVSEPAIEPLAAPIGAAVPGSYPADLFEACQLDVRPAGAPIARNVRAPPSAANDEVDGEALVLIAISDLIGRLWREETGEDLYASPTGPQNSYRGKASMARVKAGQPASPSSA